MSERKNENLANDGKKIEKSKNIHLCDSCGNLSICLFEDGSSIFERDDSGLIFKCNDYYEGLTNLANLNVFDCNERIYKIIQNNLFEMYSNKNRKYDNAIAETRKIFNTTVIARMFDKMKRIITLSQHRYKDEESLEDNLMDLINYAMIELIEINKKKNKQV